MQQVGRARSLGLAGCSLAALMLAWGAAGMAAAGPVLPTGGAVTAGAAGLSTTASNLTVNQSSAKAIITWSGFSIGQGGAVQFNNGSGATLNRVTGAAVSSIDGVLGVTGSVYLLNPNGVVIGKTGVVNTGGRFVASTLNLTDDAFLAGGDLTFSGGSTASVVNLGKVGSLGGDVALIATTVRNEGSISASQGDVGLLAGSQVLVRDTALDGGKFAVLVGGAGTSTTNTGAIAAATAELRANGGDVYALAGDTGGVISATGTATMNGRVFLVAEGGALSVTGSLHAENADKTGGAVETSGGQVSVAGAAVSTGRGGSWLIDPTDLTVDAATATTLDASLNGGTNVTLQTTATTASGPGVQTATGAGDITVAAPIAWSGAGALTLTAYRNIAVNAAVTFGGATGAGLTLNAANTLTIAAPIKVNGAGAVALAYDQNTTTPGVTDLSFGLTTAGAFAGSVTYNNANGSKATSAIAGQSLSVNGAPYTLVYTMADIANTNNALGGNYALATNIDASASIANPYTAAVVGGFSGAFEGLGNTISNLSINAPATFGGVIDLGLFASNSGTLRDFALAGGSVVANNLGGSLNGYSANTDPLLDFNVASESHAGQNTALRTGSVVARNGGTIANVASSAAVRGEYAVGGLVGANTGTIVGSMASGAVGSAASNESAYQDGLGIEVGGLVGLNYNGTVTQSWATGAVSGSNLVKAGGLEGANSNATTSASYATGAVSGGNMVGGLIGAQIDARTATVAGGLIGGQIDATTASSYATGAVSGATNIGGLIGNLGGGAVQSSYATGAVSSSGDHVGGLVGAIDDRDDLISGVMFNYTTITNSYATGGVTTVGNFAGGLIGYSIDYGHSGSETTITGVYATGAVSGSQNVGGLAGQLALATLNGANATGAVSGNQGVGGLIGQIHGVTVYNASASGAVTGVGSRVEGVGGLIGVFNTQYGDSVVANVSASSAVTAPDGANYVGGLIGVIAGTGNMSNLSNASATGSVTVGVNASNVGGLVGADGLLSTTYIDGAVLGSQPPGGGGAGGGAAIVSSWASGAVKAGSGATSVGGLIGSANNAGSLFDVGNSYATGSVTVGDNAQRIGGLIGDDQLAGLDGGGGNGYGASPIHSDFATGAVTAGANANLVGGLIGNVNTAEIDFVYATGAVTVGPQSNGVGGLAGGLDPNINSNDGLGYEGYSTGRVSAGAGSSSVDASIGANYAIYANYANEVNNGTYLYYNSDTAGVTSAVSNPATTAQFMNGTVVNALNSQSYNGYIFSGGTGGLYPYQPQIFPNGVQAISGVAHSADGSVAQGAQVGLYSGGALLGGGTASTGANGAFYEVVAAGTLPATNGKLADSLTLSGGGAAGGFGFTDSLAFTSAGGSDSIATGPAVTAGTISASTQRTGYVAMATDVATTLGATGYAALAALPGANIAVTASGNFTLDAPLSFTGGHGLTLNAAGGALAINAPVSVAGGQVSLTYNAGSPTNLSFGSGASLSFNGPEAGATQALLVNGAPYTLVYTMDELDRIDGLSAGGGANTTYGPGLGGRYALATSLNAGGITYNDALVGHGTAGFTGVFEGLGHTVSNLTVASNADYAGLFGLSSGAIRDITLANATVSGLDNVGTLAGQSDGAVVQANATGSTVAGRSSVGGLIGISYGLQGGATVSTASLVNASAMGTVTGQGNFIGGLVGYNYGAISGSQAAGSATGAYFVGGLVGVNDANGSLSAVQASASAAASIYYAGGLVGINEGQVSKATASGTATAIWNVGGLAGQNNGTIIGSTASGTVSGVSSLGGLVGVNYGKVPAPGAFTSATIANSSSTSAVYGTGYFIGELVGTNLGTVSSTTAQTTTSTLTGTGDVGALVGYNTDTGLVALPGAAAGVAENHGAVRETP